jgi:hypothetical protein
MGDDGEMDSRLRGNDDDGTTKRKAPRWVVAFLRALERTGDARASAEDAGVDHTTAYARRRAHGDFAADWADALARHADRVKAEEAADVAGVAKGLSGAPSPSLSREGRGAEVVMSAGKVRRVGNGRWSKEKEALFFDELAATANVRMAAKAAGVSPNAVFARRLRHPVFAAKWNAVVRTSQASIDLYLVEEAKKTFEPDSLDGGLDIGEVKPRVTIDQAIKISQLNASKSGKEPANPFADRGASTSGEELEAVRERLLKKFIRLAERERRARIAEGWSYDEEYGQVVPPPWVRAESGGGSKR